MNLSWTPKAWEQYLYWQETDKAVLRKLNDLLQECLRTPRTGKGKPEALKGDLRGYWSRRITDEHRLVYEVSGERRANTRSVLPLPLREVAPPAAPAAEGTGASGVAFLKTK